MLPGRLCRRGRSRGLPWGLKRGREISSATGSAGFGNRLTPSCKVVACPCQPSTQRGWLMPSSIHAAPSSARIAGARPASRQQERVDFLTGYCGLSLPTLFRRIGTMAADSQPLQTTPSSITSGPGHTPGNPIRMGIGKSPSGPIGRALVRFSGGAWPRSADACSGHHRSRREPMTARAGPLVAG